MFLFVGLGNPEAKYLGNRHNAGFMAVDALADAYGMPPFRSKFQALVTEGRIGRERVLLMKPQTFYNDSGQAVGEAVRFHKLNPDDVIVFHDEIDLAPGKLRVKKGGGLAGNRGLKSIAAHLSPDVWRVRIGVGHPGHKDAVVAHVLKDFSKEEREGWFADFLSRLGNAAEKLLPPTEESANRFVAAILSPPGQKQRRPSEAAKAPHPEKTTPKDKPAGDTNKQNNPSALGEALRQLLPKKD
ncbi:MAG: aminoacyl-tRNA hydrolase [Pseudomonadota bacterium]